MEDEKKQDDKVVNQVTKEGYLEKQSLYLKKFRKRFIILRENHLFCYENHKKTKITQFIKLASYKRAQLSNKELTQFELIPINKKETKIVFNAQSMNEAEEWVDYLNCSMAAEHMTQSTDQHAGKNKKGKGT